MAKSQEQLVQEGAKVANGKVPRKKKAEAVAEVPQAIEIAIEAEVLEVKAEEIKEQTISPEIEANKKIFYEYFNLEYAKSVAKFVLTPIEKYYFRAEFVGFDTDTYPHRNDPQRPLIFASNHSGMAFPWDGIIFAAGLMRINGYDLSKACRGLAYALEIYLDEPFFDT
jgi:hypothetical protein